MALPALEAEELDAAAVALEEALAEVVTTIDGTEEVEVWVWVALLGTEIVATEAVLVSVVAASVELAVAVTEAVAVAVEFPTEAISIIVFSGITTDTGEWSCCGSVGSVTGGRDAASDGDDVGANARRVAVRTSRSDTSNGARWDCRSGGGGSCGGISGRLSRDETSESNCSDDEWLHDDELDMEIKDDVW
jgi:uncharacterized membrane protein YgcG